MVDLSRLDIFHRLGMTIDRIRGHKAERTPPAKVVEGGNIMYKPGENEGYKGTEKPPPIHYPPLEGEQGERKG